MSRKPARKITAAAERNIPVANSTAAQRFTTIPKAVKTFGLTPVAAMASTILSSSQRLAAPMDRVIIKRETCACAGDNTIARREAQGRAKFGEERVADFVSAVVVRQKPHTQSRRVGHPNPDAR